MTDAPRVLHVGFNPIGAPSNTGLTLANMFAAWPADRLFEVYAPSRQPFTAGSNKVTHPLAVAPLDAAARKLLGSRLPKPLTDGMNNSIGRTASSMTLRTRLRLTATTLNDIGPVLAFGRWLRPVDDFGPEVLHTLLGGVRITRLVLALAERYAIPIVPHFMDDWPATLFADGRVLGIPRRQVERVLDRVMQRAPVCLTIGEDMREEFSGRFDRPCVTVGNSVDLRDYRASVSRASSGSERVVRYMGGLHLGRDRALSILAEALESERVESRLVIHAPRSDAGVLAQLVAAWPGRIVAGETVQPSDVPRYLKSADALAFVESSEPEILKFTRLSVSTKVPEYLAAGRPLIAIGPAVQSSIRALQRGPATCHAEADDVDGVRRAVSQTLSWTLRTVPPVADDVIAVFDRAGTHARLRQALTAAARAETL